MYIQCTVTLVLPWLLEPPCGLFCSLHGNMVEWKKRNNSLLTLSCFSFYDIQNSWCRHHIYKDKQLSRMMFSFCVFFFFFTGRSMTAWVWAEMTNIRTMKLKWNLAIINLIILSKTVSHYLHLCYFYCAVLACLLSVKNDILTVCVKT